MAESLFKSLKCKMITTVSAITYCIKRIEPIILQTRPVFTAKANLSICEKVFIPFTLSYKQAAKTMHLMAMPVFLLAHNENLLKSPVA